MQHTLQLTLRPEEAARPEALLQAASASLDIPLARITHVELKRRSIDARGKQVKILLSVIAYVDEPPPAPQVFVRKYPDVRDANQVLIIGAGPGGLFAALRLIELGIKPIILERGKDVQRRRRDLALLNREHLVNPDSNYCFGEGGAGTYSDGKLYTRSDKRGNIRKILERLVTHGVSQDILIDAHPHIGTNKLPQIIVAMRETILNAGGEVRFDTRVTEFLISEGRLRGVRDQDGNSIEGDRVILATGHSARDIFEMLHKQGVALEMKPFALGVRVEHPQSLIDKLQYHCDVRGEYLPPSAYALVEQVAGRGVYSFCMCPGGIIAPCATSPGEIVTNGWSPSMRNNPFANSGIVVTIEPKDVAGFASHGPLAMMAFQRSVEKRAWEAGGKSQVAPAQRMVDFVEGKASIDLPTCSYQPGITSVMLKDVLPKQVSDRLRDAFVAFGKKMRGYYTNDAVLVAPESRTSSPVRIPRDPETLQHTEIAGLYPCGEGAGYAGGIVSAAMDGERCAEKCVESLL